MHINPINPVVLWLESEMDSLSKSQVICIGSLVHMSRAIHYTPADTRKFTTGSCTASILMTCWISWSQGALEYQNEIMVEDCSLIGNPKRCQQVSNFLLNTDWISSKQYYIQFFSKEEASIIASLTTASIFTICMCCLCVYMNIYAYIEITPCTYINILFTVDSVL